LDLREIHNVHRNLLAVSGCDHAQQHPQSVGDASVFSDYPADIIRIDD
jgi:hypothetical protein